MSEALRIRPNPEAFHVLVVDDEPEVMRTLRDLVGAAGYTVTGVSTASEAMEIVVQESVDLVLTDLMMPDTNGWMLLKQVKAFNPAVVVVVVTGFVPEQGRAILTESKADGYLVKPIDRSRLHTLLKGLLFAENLGRQAEVAVLDDDAATLSSVEAALTRRGMFVETFSDAGEAMNSFRKGYPDLLVIDLHLRGLSGFDVCNQIRKDADGRDMSIVVITADPSKENVARAVSLGAEGFVAKPFDVKELGERSVQILKRRGLGR